ncbi:UPF0182 family protein [Nocardioides marmoriginsengisoli]|uniref:UPF0182 protein EFK50_13015 n=1 Tax=Nocardioides marmoriginsengisoli TaxID=661483 RepID=A0A3N0CHC9_9ACTN|nr:UPF0182 family protein [Nocardioides marmoriginsengisoli]RNL62671.1 UPF0182 family protein [Nocardioides marmoriginsengisoli]
MSDFFADDAEPANPPPQRPGNGSRRPRPLVLTLIVMAVLLIAFSLFANIWTEKLWFSSIEYSDVFNKLVWTKIGMFVVFGLLMGLVVGGNLWFAYRLRPMFRPNSPEQANLDRYREVITPIRKVLLFGASAVFAIFAGASATGQWRTFLLWQNGESFGQKDAYFKKDVGFYVFTLPWLHWLVDFMMTALVIGLIAGIFVHYIYGGIRLQSRTDKVSGAAQAQISAMLGLLVLLKGADYYLDRFDLTSASGPLITGMTYAREHAQLPSKNILMAIALVCAILFFANVFRRTWTLPGVGLALFALSAVVLGLIWPALVQRLQVKPDEPDKEATYIANNIQATRAAYGLDDTKVTDYSATTALNTAEVLKSPSIPGIRILDPAIVRDAFEQLQQQKAYYTVQPILDVDNYTVDGVKRDMVVGAREININGLPPAQQKWANVHTVYTHGYGMIAAYGNQRNGAGVEVPLKDSGGQPVFAERSLPPTGVLSSTDDGYRGQIYFGENSPNYSIVGKAPGGKDVELDLPQGGESGGISRASTYDGKDGVEVGGIFNKLLYAVKLGDPNMVLSSRVNSNSKILYDRSPIKRVQKVAPWLTIDKDPLPAVVDGKIVWILDGYTLTDRYPLSEKRSLQDMTSDAISPRPTYATLPTDNINYMRNAVKATVDAYDGTVTLYEWDEEDPILKAWESAFPGVVKSKDSIPEDLLDHFRYPEDMFKVQRNILAEYHVSDPKAFYEANDKWEVPADPDRTTTKQPPYRLSVEPAPGESPVYSLTSVYVPANKDNLTSFMSVGADASDPETYGKFQILRLPDSTQFQGPGNVANQFSVDPKVAEVLRNFKTGTDAGVRYGNLLTLPVGGGLLYVQPLYTVREGSSGKYPVLLRVLATYGKDVGIGTTLSEALENIGQAAATPADGTDTPEVPEPPDGGTGGTGGGGELPTRALQLLAAADRKFTAADAALRRGDLTGYATNVAAGRDLVEQALAVGKKQTKPTQSPTSTAKP